MTTQDPGAEFAGYRIESLIGRGGMAVVYRAEDMRLGRRVALKLLSPQLAESDQFRQRFIRESRLAASLDHPNIVPIYEAGEADGQLFIAMRYVLGSDLKGLLTEGGGSLPEDQALRLFGQIGDALDSAHEAGLVHRDVKPGNILVAAAHDHARSAHGGHVYLTDFGLTKRTSELTAGLTGAGHMLGTPDYISPEQIQGKPVGPATDIYALGCVLYECLTGQLPFRRDDDAALLWAHLVETPAPVTGIRPELPEGVSTVVARAMAKDPADRYQSCQDLVRDLELAFGVPAPVASPSGPWTRDGGGTPHQADDTSDGPRRELGTVAGDVLGGSRHPSFPSGPFERFPGQANAWHGTAQPTDHEPDLVDDEPDPEEYPGSDQGDGVAPWEQGEPAAPPALARRRRGWLIALVAAAAVLIAVAAVLLRSSLQPQGYQTYSSGGTVVRFQLDHPAGWAAEVGRASDVVLGPDPRPAAQVFFLKGTAQAWGSAASAVRSGSPQNVGLYVFTSATTFDTSSPQALMGSIEPLLPMITQFGPEHRDVSVARTRADELEAVVSDPQQPQTRLRLLVDVVEPPGAEGAVLLAFFAPPGSFENNRSTFEKVRDSLTINP
jgi:serine/threonine protein kinase